MPGMCQAVQSLDLGHLQHLAFVEWQHRSDVRTLEEKHAAGVAQLEERRNANLASLYAFEETQRLGAVEAQRAAAEAAAAAHEAARASERIEAHDIANRLLEVESLCAGGDVPVHAVRAVIAKGLEAVDARAAAKLLDTNSYRANPSEDGDVGALVAKRLRRYRGASRDTTDATDEDDDARGSAAAVGGAAVLDPLLFTLILDCLLSNAFKHGDADKTPRVHMDDAAAGTEVRIEVRSAAGVLRHAALVSLGDGALSKTRVVSGLSGSLATARAGAKVLGGTLCLAVAPHGVVATLALRCAPPDGRDISVLAQRRREPQPHHCRRPAYNGDRL
ncbi:hypothetical protein M885DRAFT_511646 [Pelagophyceae sp. CCMP2097]|nr:hypothetical protein M885DRAFT_511646 [Pelagophyceae sp. CCMP2097]